MKDAMAVVDTNVISYIFKDDTRRLEYAHLLKSYNRLLLSFQTMAELEFWTLKRNWGYPRKAELAELTNAFVVIESDETIWKIWARIRYQRASVGMPLHPEDAWIAATALSLDCPLITHDRKDFERIQNLQILSSS